MTKNDFDRPGPLMRETLEMLIKRDLLIIYTETGLPYHWLSKFSAGKIKNPSVNRVQFLNEYLKKQPS